MFGINVASPADKDGVFNCVEQIQLKNVKASGEHNCQLDLQGTLDYRSLSAGDETLDILCGWKEIHPGKIE